MPKRFRDTNIGRQVWYRKLSPEFKCCWNLICDECDGAGVWSIDEDYLEFSIGKRIDLKQFINEVNAEKLRIECLDNSKLFIVGFIQFQYGELSESCKPHQHIINLLHKHNIYERVCKGLDKGLLTLQEKEKEKEKEKDKEEEKTGKSGSIKKSKSIFSAVNSDNKESTKKQTDEYDSFIGELSQNQDRAKIKKDLAAYITEKQPQIIAPYIDLWNLVAQSYNLATIRAATPSRNKKFNVRIREQQFDFVEILRSITKSDYLLGKQTNWRVDFDWLFENDTNYMKVLEGKY